MKKFLSLVLSLAMAMSLVTVGAGAKEFKDDNKIAYDEAVAVISELGVVDGYESGNFNPEGGLTRGAAAKIICNMVLGPTTASALSADAKSFKDVPTNHPFAGYIAYCAQQGIINGYDSNTFKPEAPLTGNHFMKMLLGALGYDGEVEGFTGPNWTINVSKLAYGLKLDDGNKDAVLSKPITRQEAALYAFNTLKADMVEYDTKTTVSKGDLVVQIAGTDAKKILQRDSGYKDTMEPGVARDQQTLQFAEKYFDKLTMTGNGRDAFGRPATEWKYKSNVIDTFTDYSDMVAEYEGEKAPMGELYSTIGSSIVDKLQTSKAAEDYYFQVFVDGEKVAAPAAADYFVKNSTKAAGVAEAATSDYGKTGNGVLTQVFMDDDNNVTVSIINTFLVQATADFNSTKNEVTIEILDLNEEADAKKDMPPVGAKLDGDDFDVAGVKEDDYLLVNYSYDSKDVEEVMPAKMLTGKVTQYTETDNVVVDGTKYEYVAIAGKGVTDENFTINENASLVLDQYGHIIYVDEALTTNSFVYIAEFGGTSGLGKKAVADAYFTDGTNAEIPVKKVDGKDTQSDISSMDGKTTKLQNSKWYTFSKNSDGEYTLNSVKGNRTSGEVSNEKTISAATTLTLNERVQFMNSAVALVDLKSDGTWESSASTVKLLANKDTVFVTRDSDDDVNVYVGVENAPEITVRNGSANIDANKINVNYVIEDGYVSYVFIDLKADPSAHIKGNVVNDYMMILNKVADGKTTYVDGNEYAEFEVLVDGKVETRMIDTGLVADSKVAIGNLVYDVQVNKDKYIDDVTAFDPAKESTQVKAPLNNGTITKSGNSVTFQEIVSDTGVASGESHSAYTTKDTKINLVIADTAPALMKDTGADYEIYLNTSLGTVTGLIANYKVTGTAYVVLTDDSDKTNVAKELYIYITGTTGGTDVPTPPAPPTGDSVLAPGTTVNFATGAFSYYKADGTAITAAETKTVLEKAGAKDVVAVNDGGTVKYNYTAPDGMKCTNIQVKATQTFKVTDGTTVKYVTSGGNFSALKGNSKGTGVLATDADGATYHAYGNVTINKDTTIERNYVSVAGFNATPTAWSTAITASNATLAVNGKDTAPGYAKVDDTLTLALTVKANSGATDQKTDATLTATGATIAPQAKQEVTGAEAKAGATKTWTVTVGENNITALTVALAD